MPVKQRVEFSEVSQKMWPAAVVLAEYFLQSGVARGVRVLELGCGVGFTGMVLAKRGGCSKLVLSDYSQSGLDLLQENLELNGCSSEVGVWRLDWTDATLTDEQLGCFDLVYAADCWYDYEMAEVLTGLVKRICLLNGKCPFINATAIRNPKTYELYRNTLLEAGFEAKELFLKRSDKPVFRFDSNERYSVVMEQYTLS